MPALGPRELVQAILDAIEDSGYSGIFVSPVREHPRKFVITSPQDEGFVLWAYVWTLTPGGRPTLPHEYRIQMTTVASPLPLNPDGPTALLGYETSLNLFAGFDLVRHRTFTSGSPSVQIDIRTVQEAMQHGLTFDRKTNSEIAVGIRPNRLMDYVLNANALHRHGSATITLLNKAATLQPIAEVDFSNLNDPRKRIVQAISRLARNANFRQQVLYAYGNRCAVTRAQLRLVDAAHILPVGAPGSIDDVRNGLALAPTYHRAYDNGLIYLDETFTMRVNPQKEKDLGRLKLDGGLPAFRETLGKILLPPDRQQWPNAALIRKANVFRRVEA